MKKSLSVFLVMVLALCVLLAGCNKTDVNSELSSSELSSSEPPMLSQENENIPDKNIMSYYNGMTMKDIIAIWGSDYKLNDYLIGGGWAGIYYEDDRCPFTFCYSSFDIPTTCDLEARICGVISSRKPAEKFYVIDGISTNISYDEVSQKLDGKYYPDEMSGGNTFKCMSVENIEQILFNWIKESQIPIIKMGFKNLNPPKTYTTTIARPEEVRFYKGGKYCVSKESGLNREISRAIEMWYKDYEDNTIPFTNSAATKEMIAEIKLNETVIEICFDSDEELKMLDKVNIGKRKRLLIPLTGKFAYYIFWGQDDYTYQGGQYNLGGSGLEKYFESITLDKEVQKWESTVASPSKVTFYKDGKQSVSTDKEFNHKIAQHIEEWCKYVTMYSAFSGITTTENITYEKYNSTAIELEFDEKTTFYGGVLHDDRKIFISLDGKHPYRIFTTDGFSERWGNLSPCNPGVKQDLEQFFTGRVYEEIPSASRWESTVIPPNRIQLYKNGKMLEELTDKDVNHKIAQNIESWYLYQESIKLQDTPNAEETILNIRKNETYIELIFHSEIKFYGQHIVDKDTCCLLIPITGDYAYCMFVSDNTYNYNQFSFDGKSKKLDDFFDTLK